METDTEVKMTAPTVENDVVDDLFAPVLPNLRAWWLKRCRTALLNRYYAKMDAKAGINAQIKAIVAELNKVEQRIKSTT